MAPASTGKAARTKREILARALDLASVEGLEALTIGRLAAATSMSKSGLFAHFGSKEDLQLAVVDAASEVFAGAVLEPTLAAGPGLERLATMAREWLGYVERGLFRGGCFFAAVSAEVDDRPGRVRDRVALSTRDWLDRIDTEARTAIEQEELRADCDPGQLAFEIHAFVQEANWAFQLHGDAEAFSRAQRAIAGCLDRAASESGREALDSMGLLT